MKAQLYVTKMFEIEDKDSKGTYYKCIQGLKENTDIVDDIWKLAAKNQKLYLFSPYTYFVCSGTSYKLNYTVYTLFYPGFSLCKMPVAFIYVAV